VVINIWQITIGSLAHQTFCNLSSCTHAMALSAAGFDLLAQEEEFRYCDIDATFFCPDPDVAVNRNR